MNVHPYTTFHNHQFRYRTWEKLRKFQQNLKKCPSRLCINPPSTNPDACHQLCQCKDSLEGMQTSPESLGTQSHYPSKIRRKSHWKLFSPFFSPIPKMSAEFLKETLLNKGRLASFQILMEMRLQNIFSIQPQTVSSKSNNNSTWHDLHLQSLHVLPDQQHCREEPNLIQLL